MKLTNRQTATVLAALRLWQGSDFEKLPKGVPYSFRDHFANEKPLSNSAIDRLCEQINTDQGAEIVIICDGGLVHEVLSSEELGDCTVLDYDTEGADPDELTPIPQGKAGDFEDAAIGSPQVSVMRARLAEINGAIEIRATERELAAK